METNDGQIDTTLEEERLKAVLESLLFAAGEPVSLAQLANALEEVPRDRIRKALSEMAASYASSGRGFLLEEIAGGYQLRTRSEHANYVRRLLSAKPPRLSRPVLETLAIIAYRQPMTRPEIEQLRGVDSGGVLDTLTERNLIKIAGRKEAPGRPIMYATTPDFLELFGLKDLDSLPDLEEFRALEGSLASPEPPQMLPEPPQSATRESSPEPAVTEQEPGASPADQPVQTENDVRAAETGSEEFNSSNTATQATEPANNDEPENSE